MEIADKPVLVTGATGYVGGRLVPRLLEAGYRVRAVGRSLHKLACHPWAHSPNIELATADVMDFDSMCAAAYGCGAVYYLVHSMGPGGHDFASADRAAAMTMMKVADHCGLDRVIYLSGLNPSDPGLSKHLRSRAEVAEILSRSRVPLTVLRAAVIIGSGSASFELLRYLTDRLPVMVTPRWVRTENQPISITNVLGYLIGCLEHPETMGQTYDICGPYVETYETLFQMYAEVAGLKRRHIIPLPVLSPTLSSYWVGLVSPIPQSLARPLIKGLKNRVVCMDYRIRHIIPQELIDCRTAIRLALDKIAQLKVETRWSDAGSVVPPEWAAENDAHYAGGTILRCGFRARLKGPAKDIWRAVERIGGDIGWYYGDKLWAMRGFVDKLLGGVGLRRGRRHPTELLEGDALDFWRVVQLIPEQRLLLLAEMKLPGEALLDIRLDPVESQKQRGKEWYLSLTARFLPKGLAGMLYWYPFYPAHFFIFRGMLRGLAASVGVEVIGKPEPFEPGKLTACPLPQNILPDFKQMRKAEAEPKQGRKATKDG